MNVLITGATGFIGQHLLEELAGDGLQIKIISRQKDPKFWCSNKNFRVLQADMADKQSMKEAFQDTELVINLAAELKRNENFESTNILGVQNIIELSRENKVKKIIHLSSVGVVGMQYSLHPVSVDENTPCDPHSGYERTKLRSEEIIKSAGIPYAILRPTNVFGDHHPRKALLGFLQRIKTGKTFPLKKGALVNYVYVKDVAQAIRYFILNDTGNKTVNVGETVLLKNFIELAAHQAGVSYKIKNVSPALFSILNAFDFFGIGKLKEKARGISNQVTYLDEFMKKTIGYSYGLKTGIKNSIEFYRNQKAL